MPTWPSLQAFVADLGKTLPPEEQRAITRSMARSAAFIATIHARRDLGADAAFSGRAGQSPSSPGSWAGPARALSSLKIKPGRDNVHWMFPTKKSGGPWKVAQQGRNQGNVNPNAATAGKFFGPSIDRGTGQTFRTKTGKIRQTRTRRSGRWNGYTKGKNTATEAGLDIQRQLPIIADRAVLKAYKKRFDVT